MLFIAGWSLDLAGETASSNSATFFLGYAVSHGDLHQEKPGDYENDAYGG